MFPSPILSVIHTITIGTMLNINSGNSGRRLKTVTRKQTLTFCEIKATSSQRKLFVQHKLK